ncbi:tail fiber domain-containing protein [Tropicibacter oceani]|uniref:Tail fiber domain-containing protein n=1 Tax=Tropicibacter oceani TaxID=3058420 RepID=A0ABY8QPU9_9RHOB|nr:tail fiber domain-containing protein [Tropicibacter oceani]WGW06051.1 tail fiber domain-containing protein [Tropicibacter oceani]
MFFAKTGFKSAALGASALVALAGIATADVVHLDDVIVDGSICVGQDCVNGESFGFDTIRLKENNLRIKAQDTSNSASFPTVDWQITFNDSSNGGANKFAIDDIDSGRTPFTIEASTRSHQLYLSDSNKVGFGTSTPVADLHVKQGNTPTLRLEQDGSSGFAAQVFDVASNEANFFIRDASNGSRLPFRIQPGAPTNALYIDSAGEIGLGASTNPTAPLHVKRSDGSSSVLIEETNGAAAARGLLTLKNNGGSFITMSNTDTGVDWFFTYENAAAGRMLFARSDAAAESMSLGADGSFQVGGDGSAAQGGMSLDASGNLTIGGTLAQSSDKHAKMAIVPVDSQEVLAKVSALPLSSWTYIHDAKDGTRHIGPMAQDFHAAFGTGKNDTTISTLDTSGVALAAIQALSAQNEAQQALIAKLSERLEMLETRIAAD